MKKPYRITLYSILLYLMSTIVVTYWYISDHLLSSVSNIQTQSVIDIVIQIGLYGALIPTVTFLLSYFLIRKVKSKWLLGFFLIALVLLVISVSYWFILNTVFHTFDNPILFK